MLSAEQKQRAIAARREWIDYEWSGPDGGPAEFEVVEIANKMVALLQELVDAPEPEPVAEVVLSGGLIRYTTFVADWVERFGKADCAVKLYTSPPAPSVPDGWRDILEAVLREMPAHKGIGGNAPGHSHATPGVWDGDNGPLSGKPCAWCLTWNKAKKMLAEAQANRKESI